MHGFDTSIPPGHDVTTESSAVDWLRYFLRSHSANGGLGLDTETTGLDLQRDRIIVWSLSDGQERICLPAEFIPIFKEPLLENPHVDFDFTKSKFDCHMFANSGVDLSKAGEWRSTDVQSFLLNENNTGRHGLKECIVDHFGRVTPTFEQTFGKVPPKRVDKNTGRILSKQVGDLVREAFQDPVRRPVAVDYASLDAYNSTTLRTYFDEKLDEIVISSGYTLKDYYYAVEVPFTKVLWKMERRGITIDKGHLLLQKLPMEKRMEEIEKSFSRELQEEMNLKSNKDVRKFFFQHCGKTPTKMTKGGKSGNKQAAIDEEVLDKWAGEGDQWALLALEHRGIAKIDGTYVKGLSKWLDHWYRIHTKLNQTGAVTMRLSSSEPNLQNIPRADSDVYKIREAFVPSELMRLVVADYEQLEMRLMAHFSGDEKMIQAILNGIDLHCLTVAEMYGIPYDEVMAAKKADKDVKSGKRKEPLTKREEELLFYRQAAKATGFGIIYGIGGPHLAYNLTKELKRFVSPEEGVSLIKKWFGVFPGVKEYVNYVHEILWKKGEVQTLVGRFRRFGDLHGMSRMDAARAERQSVNSIIQGTAADIAKRSMLLAEDDKELRELGARMLLQIHDEIIWECPDDDEVVGKVKRRAKQIMENPFPSPLRVPLPAEVGSGYTWSSAK